MSQVPPRGFATRPNTILTRAISEDAWEERLRLWSRPATDTEEATIERAARMVRGAIEDSAWMVREGVTVHPQGSYHNNTNVRIESDMDIRIVHPSIHVLYDPAYREQAVAFANNGDFVWMPRSVRDIVSELRSETGKALRYAFGDGVRPGKKAFRVPKVQGSRSDIDIAPTLRLHFITATMRGRSFMQGPAMDRVEGIALFDEDGNFTANFPDHHHAAGKRKWHDTNRQFKKVVRQLKKMKDHLIADGKLEGGKIPSFLVENLVYNVENEYFAGGGTRLSQLRAVLSRSYQQVSDADWAAGATEISGWKRLFGAHAAWTPADCMTFLSLAWDEVR